MTPEASTLPDLERLRLRALAAGDTDTAAPLHADDYQLITPNGSPMTKDDYRAAHHGGVLRDPVRHRRPARIAHPPSRGPGRGGSEVAVADVEKYLAALRRAQQELDLNLERYRHYHLRAVPEKYRDQVDVRAFGLGERIVFLPYTREAFDATQQWTETHQIFPHLAASAVGYDEAALA